MILRAFKKSQPTQYTAQSRSDESRVGWPGAPALQHSHCCHPIPNPWPPLVDHTKCKEQHLQHCSSLSLLLEEETEAQGRELMSKDCMQSDCRKDLEPEASDTSGDLCTILCPAKASTLGQGDGTWSPSSSHSLHTFRSGTIFEA